MPIVLDMDFLSYLYRLVGKPVVHDLPVESLELRTYIVPIELLRAHERVITDHVDEVLKLILAFLGFKHSILVDARTFTVLDGHHRLKAAKILGLNYVPVFFVDYAKDYVDVTTWRKNFIVNKKIVITAALKGIQLPPKTSRHMLYGVTVHSTYVALECLKKMWKHRLPYIPPTVCTN